MPRKAPRKAKNTKRPARGANARPGRKGQKGAGVIAGGVLLGLGALLVKGLVYITPTKEQIRTFWSKAWARKASYVTGALLVSLLVLSGMKSSLEEDEKYQIDPAGIEISTEQLSWLNAEGSKALLATIQDDISKDLADIESSNAFDEELLTQVAETMQANPWIAEVKRVTRRFPNDDEGARFAAEVKIRKPVLAARVGDTLYFVDQDGVSLPLEMKVDGWTPIDAEQKALLHSIPEDVQVRWVSNVGGKRPTPGQVWENEQIKAALSMEKTIREHKIGRIIPILQIDVSHISPRKDWRGKPYYNADGGVVLVPKTSKQSHVTEIIWGKASIHAGSFEPSIDVKLRRLKAYVDADPSLQSTHEVRLNTKG